MRKSRLAGPGFLGVMAMVLAAGAFAEPLNLFAAQSYMLFAQAKNNYIRGQVTNSITGNPVEGVDITLSAEIGKQIDFTATDANGNYEFDNIQIVDQLYMISFAKREYIPDTLRNIGVPSSTADKVLEPVGVTIPRNVIAYSGPKSIYVEWDANPEYNLQGYYVWRTMTDAVGAPLGDAEKITDLLPASTQPEYTDTAVGVNQFYKYEIQALSAADRESGLSSPSNIVRAQFLQVFFPDVSVQNNVAGLYLWDLTPSDLVDNRLVRLPLSTECAYQVDAAGMDIVAELPNNLIQADQKADVQVLPTGITEGMLFSYNILNVTPEKAELRISSAAAESRSLYGTGVLFDVYAQIRTESGCGDLALVEDQPGFREGVRLYDITPAPIDLELHNGTLCVDTDPCVHGDVNEDRQITADDAQWVTDIKVGEKDPDQLGLLCFPWSSDINQDQRVDSADASMILQWIKNGSLNPPPAAGKSVEERKAAAYAAWDEKDAAPTVTIGQVSGNPGQTVQVPVTITTATDLPLAGFSLLVAYPAGTDGLVYQNCVLGDELEGQFSLSVNNSIENNWYGAVQIAASNDTELASKGTVTLVTLTFKIANNAPAGVFPVRIMSFESNDPYGFTPRHDAPGQAEILQAQPQQDYTLTVAVQGPGTTDPAAGPHSYLEGSVVTLTAYPNDNAIFVRWEGPVADTANTLTTVTLTDNITVTAVFEQQVILTIQTSGQGTTAPAAGAFVHSPGDVVQLTATPAEGWEFEHWEGAVADTASPATTVTVNADMTVTAVFVQNDEKENQFLWCAPGSGNNQGGKAGDLLFMVLTAVALVSAPNLRRRAENR